jgi:hypothetical protein
MRVEITKNKNYYRNLVIFGYIYRNLAQFSDGTPRCSPVGKSIGGIENYGLRDTIHLSRKGGRLFLAAPVFPICQRTAIIPCAQYPIY